MKMKYSILAVLITFFAISCSSDDNGSNGLEAQDVAGEWTLQSYSKDHSKITTGEDGEVSTKEGRETLTEGDVSFSFIKSGELVITYSDAVFEDNYTENGQDETLISRPKSTELGTWSLLEEKGQLVLKGFSKLEPETTMDIINYSETKITLQADLGSSDSEDEENANSTTYKLVLVRK